MKTHVRLVLDSGAYTAFKQNEEIPLKKYIRFCLRNQHLISAIVNLDVIPRSLSPKDVEEAAERGWQNLCQMRLVGLNPIAVYHRGERRYWLEKMLGEGCQYIGLGGVANAGDKARKPWLDSVFEYLCGKCNYPSVKVHGFGVTSVEMMKRYPWTSVDSISWMKQGVIGSVYVPKWHGEYNYHTSPMTVGMSESGKKGPSATVLMNQAHYNGLGPQIKAYVDAYAKQEGIKISDLKTKYKQRVRINSRFFKRFCDAYNHYDHPFVALSRVFGLCPQECLEGSETKPPHFRLVFSVGTYLEYSNILRQEGIRDLLVSFHRIENGPKFDFAKFVKTGWFCRATRPDEVIV